MIPVLGVATLNQPQRLLRMLDSIDVPVGRVLVVDNGGVVNYGPRHATQSRHVWETEVHVVRTGHNLGVAASWNLVLKSSPRAAWWLIVNDDVEFCPGALQKLVDAIDPMQRQIVHLLGFAAFAMTAPALDRLGYFDENFHPAYDEDVDMSRRAELAGVPRITVEAEVEHEGSATIYANDGAFREANHRTHMENDRYYARKWGGPKEGGETFVTPFNRGGWIGDWTLQPEHLRRQTW